MSDFEDSDDSRTLSPREALEYDLQTQISGVHSAGSFATSAAIDTFVNPGISVDSIGIIRLPLSEQDAHAIVQVSRKAPFGKGSETLVDESVRDTWEIGSDKLQFLNPQWQDCLNEIVKRAATELGVVNAATSVRAELYKMLLYEKWCSFKPHKDTEKVPGMFGTLVICLPSEHIGGAVSLQHGENSCQFDMSKNSSFGASYAAWYTDVTHEVQTVIKGHRWVLTYHLITQSKHLNPSASIQDSRLKEFTQILGRWISLSDKPSYLIFPLDHQYTNRDLKLSHLKGDDYYRALHVSQGCEKSGFYPLLANVTMNFQDPNNEENECHDEEDSDSAASHIKRELSLSKIVDTAGFDLLVYERMIISEHDLLRPIHYRHRDPDVQCGGNYLGNSYAGIEQFFNDSVLIMVRRFDVRQFLLGRNSSHKTRYRLLKNLQTNIQNKVDVKTLVDVHFWIYVDILIKDYSNLKQQDLFLGPAAVAAAFVKDRSRFSRIVEKTAQSFHKSYYSALGELVNLQELDINEDDLILSLTKNGTLHQTHENLYSFYKGFHQGNSDRLDQIRIKYLQRWLSHLAYGCLSKSKQVYAEDAYSLVRIILEREEDPFSQLVLYQGVRIFFQRFKNHAVLTNALIVELLLQPQRESQSGVYIKSLLKLSIDAAISNFDLLQYALYVKTRDSTAFKDAVRDTYGESIERQDRPTGPIKAFFELANAQEQGTPRLLQVIQKQISSFTIEQISSPSLELLKTFLPVLLEDLLLLLDCSSVEVQKCAQSLVIFYITSIVGYEPRKPTDWARPGEIKISGPRFCACDDCLKMRTFLKDSELQRHVIRSEISSHLRWAFHFFDYFDVEEVDGRPIAVTKTLLRWEKDHKTWETRSAEVLERLRGLPQEELKRCLGHQYDEIMSFSLFKAGADAPKDTNQKRRCEEVESTESEKRQREG
ncbi:MAG: hypothetical protein M1814_003794 [Vezdaea aestivalis]|nr:MAG: hypothetical protein M1814_003794 [Vezdaea aestivalis]